MGSVGPDYVCLVCGRTGKGGYHVDGINTGPICTQGATSCLNSLLDGKWDTVNDFRIQALDGIFQNKCVFWNEAAPEILERIVSFFHR